jgi:hypothetical protein
MHAKSFIRAREKIDSTIPRRKPNKQYGRLICALTKKKIIARGTLPVAIVSPNLHKAAVTSYLSVGYLVYEVRVQHCIYTDVIINL